MSLYLYGNLILLNCLRYINFVQFITYMCYRVLAVSLRPRSCGYFAPLSTNTFPYIFYTPLHVKKNRGSPTGYLTSAIGTSSRLHAALSVSIISSFIQTIKRNCMAPLRFLDFPNPPICRLAIFPMPLLHKLFH